MSDSSEAVALKPCACGCGEVVGAGRDFVSGHNLRTQDRHDRRSHGHAVHGEESPTYVSWQAMLARCRYVDRDTERKHVGRGISVCDRWRAFECFLADMGERPPGRTLDRIDNDGDYEPGNCRWATPVEQARNRRNGRLDFQQAVQVAKRRLLGERCKTIAADFGVSESLPREIAAGRSWPDALAQAKRELECQNS